MSHNGYRVEYEKPIVLGFPYTLRLGIARSHVANMQLAPD